MRTLFFGTPDFALPTLERLLASPHSVVAVVSQPDRPAGRGRVPRPSPVSRMALRAGVLLLRPERVGDESVVASLRAARPDVGVVVAFGQFLPRRVRELPGCGYLINAHASLLPGYRGAAPIARAMLAGERTTGISVMRVERKMDAGPVACSRSIEIGPEETCDALTDRLARLAADAILAVLEQIDSGCVRWQEQDHARATSAPKLSKRDAHIDWKRPADQISNQVRALANRPGAVTTLSQESLRILAARAEGGSEGFEPGTVLNPEDGGLRVATGKGWLCVQRVQRSGGRPLDIADFLRGRAIPDGTRLGGDV